MEDQVGEVRGDQLAARRCYVEMVRAEAKSARKMPRVEVNAITEKPSSLVYEEKEEVQIHPARPEATTFIASDLEAGQKEELIGCLQRNYDVFAWSTHELPGVSPVGFFGPRKPRFRVAETLNHPSQRISCEEKI